MSDEQEVQRVNAVGELRTDLPVERIAITANANYPKGALESRHDCPFCKAVVMVPLTMVEGRCPQCDFAFRRGDFWDTWKYLEVTWAGVESLPRWAQGTISDYKRLYVAEHLRACRRQTEVTAAVLTLEFAGQNLTPPSTAKDFGERLETTLKAVSDVLHDVARSTASDNPMSPLSGPARRHDIDLLPYIDRISGPKPGERIKGFEDDDSPVGFGSRD